MSRRLLLIGAASAGLVGAMPEVGHAAMPSAAIAGASTTYTNAQDGYLIVRSNGGADMFDTLPGTSPGILNAGTVVTVYNDDAIGNIVFSPGSGAQLDSNSPRGGSQPSAPAPGSFIIIGPGQTAAFQCDGAKYRTIQKPYRCRLARNIDIQLNALTGADTNHGLTTGAAFKTLQAGWDYCFYNFDLNGWGIRFRLAPGTYSPGVVAQGLMVGQNLETLEFIGDSISGVTVHDNSGNACFMASGAAEIYVRDLTMTAEGPSPCVNAVFEGFLTFTNVVFGSCAVAHVNARTYGYINANEVLYYISGSAAEHFAASSKGIIELNCTYIVLVGTPAFSNCVRVAR